MDYSATAIASLSASGAAAPPPQLSPTGSTEPESWDVILQTPGVHIGHRIGLFGKCYRIWRFNILLGVGGVAVMSVVVERELIMIQLSLLVVVTLICTALAIQPRTSSCVSFLQSCSASASKSWASPAAGTYEHDTLPSHITGAAWLCEAKQADCMTCCCCTGQRMPHAAQRPAMPSVSASSILEQ